MATSTWAFARTQLTSKVRKGGWRKRLPRDIITTQRSGNSPLRSHSEGLTKSNDSFTTLSRKSASLSALISASCSKLKRISTTRAIFTSELEMTIMLMQTSILEPLVKRQSTKVDPDREREGAKAVKHGATHLLPSKAPRNRKSWRRLNSGWRSSCQTFLTWRW